MANPHAADPTLLMLFQHKTWATLSLIEHLQGLDEAQLQSSVPGTYGSIQDTLQHLVGAEESYYQLITGERFAERMTPEPVPLAELARRVRLLGPKWEQLAADPDAAAREVRTRDGWRTTGALIMAQAIHHADDHRSHVLSTVGARGLDLPGLDIGEDLDVWHWGMADGSMRPGDGGSGS